MAFVVGLSAIVTQKLHRVIFSDMLRVVLHELFDAVPEGRDGLVVLIQTQHETVLFVVLLHVSERVEADVAVQLDAGLNTPVVLKLLHQFVPEEEPGLVTAHVPVADRVTVDDLALLHVLPNLPGLLLVDPFRVRPMLRGDQTIVRLAGDERRCDFLEGIIEGLVVQEDPVVVVVAVETVLHLPDRLRDLPDVRVPGQCHEGGIHTPCRRDGSTPRAVTRWLLLRRTSAEWRRLRRFWIRGAELGP